MPYSTNPKAQHVWEKARRVKGKNRNLYRRDAQGNLIYKPAFNRDSPMGWQVDHIWPRSKGGSDARRNLQALQTAANKRKSNKTPRRAKASSRSRRW